MAKREMVGVAVIISLIILGTALWLYASYLDTKANYKPISTYEVCDKIEVDDRCFINIWVEVTPEEYIGLDIGDEYERTEE